MVKKFIRILKDFIIRYNLAWYLLIIILLMIFKEPLFWVFCMTMPKSIKAPISKLIKPYFGLGLFIIWLFFFIINLREKRYTQITGRYYYGDHLRYRKSYSELVRFYKNAEPQRFDLSKLPKKSWHDSHGFILGKTPDGHLISFEPGENGVVYFVWGTPGVGKTTSVIITSARQWGLYKDENGLMVQRGAVMAVDLKGDIYEANKNYRKIKRFSTIDWQNSCHFDPLLEARCMNDEDRAIYLENQSFTIVLMEGGKDEAYFVKGARSWYVGVVLYCLHLNNDYPFGEICDEVPTKSYDEWGQIIEDSGYLPAIKYIKRFRDENPRNVGGIYSKLCESLKLYSTKIMKALLTSDGECISPRDLEECTDVYLQVDPTELDLYAPLIAMLFQIFMSAALKRPQHANPPIAYIIDEFGSIPQIPVLSRSAMLMRAYNASIMISTQSLESLTKHYGDSGRKILMDCAKGHVFLCVNDIESRKWASSLVGTRKVLKVSNSESTSINQSIGRSVNETRESVIESELFSLLPDDHSVIIWKDGHYIKAEACYYLDQ